MVHTRQDTERALDSLDERIARFVNLEPGWDSYGAKSISSAAITTAQDILRSIVSMTEPTIGERALSVWVAPLPNGGVLLEWHGATANLEVEITASGALELLLEERVGETSETSERTDVRVEDIASLLDKVLAA